MCALHELRRLGRVPHRDASGDRNQDPLSWYPSDIDRPRVRELLDPDVEWVILDIVPWGGTYHGPSGVEAYLTNALEYLDVSASGAEFREFFHDGDKVVDIAMSYGRVKSTGRDFVMPTVHVTTVKAGKIVRMQSFYDPGNAIRAVEGHES